MNIIQELWQRVRQKFDYKFIIGTRKDDEIPELMPGPFIFFGLDGNDIAEACDGVDLLFGGDGDDLLVGFGGNDLIVGGNGDDRLFGTRGQDWILGGPGNDRIISGHHIYHVAKGNKSTGDDYLHGGDGNDEIEGGESNDLIIGAAGDDTLSGGDGSDRIYGGDGDDLLYGNATGESQLFGGPGNDTFVVQFSSEGTTIATDYEGNSKYLCVICPDEEMMKHHKQENFFNITSFNFYRDRLVVESYTSGLDEYMTLKNVDFHYKEHLDPIYTPEDQDSYGSLELKFYNSSIIIKNAYLGNHIKLFQTNHPLYQAQDILMNELAFQLGPNKFYTIVNEKPYEVVHLTPDFKVYDYDIYDQDMGFKRSITCYEGDIYDHQANEFLMDEYFVLTKDIFKGANDRSEICFQFHGQDEFMMVDLLDPQSNFVIKDVYIVYAKENTGNELMFVHDNLKTVPAAIQHDDYNTMYHGTLDDFLNAKLCRSRRDIVDPIDGCTLKAKIAFAGQTCSGEYFITPLTPIAQTFAMSFRD